MWPSGAIKGPSTKLVIGPGGPRGRMRADVADGSSGASAYRGGGKNLGLVWSSSLLLRHGCCGTKNATYFYMEHLKNKHTDTLNCCIYIYIYI